MTGERIGAVLTDHDLVEACSTSRVREFEATGRRVYRAVFEWTDYRGRKQQTDKTFAVNAAGFAQVYAREYAARIMPSGTRVLSVRWAR